MLCSKQATGGERRQGARVFRAARRRVWAMTAWHQAIGAKAVSIGGRQ